MENYFAVLNADNQFLSENEALATGFIRYDNAVQDYELGLVSEIEVLRLQTEYEVIRQKRHLAVQRQRLTRNILAEAMGYPGQLASDLEIPPVDSERNLPDDVDMLVTRALQFSLEALVAMANTRAAQAAIKIADSADGPTLDLELEVSTYERETRTRDDWRAGLYIEIPLYAGSSPAKVNLATAKYRQALAHQQQLQSHLRLQVLRLWQQLKQLQLENQGRAVEQDYRDRYLDRSRAEYELEFKTDLGDSMVLYSRSNAERMQTPSECRPCMPSNWLTRGLPHSLAPITCRSPPYFSKWKTACVSYSPCYLVFCPSRHGPSNSAELPNSTSD